MSTSASRWFVTALLILSVFAPSASAQAAGASTAASITGVYNGTYASAADATTTRSRSQPREAPTVSAGEQAPIKFKLAISQQDNGALVGTFTLYRPDGADTKSYTRDLAGHVFANGTFLLAGGKWDTPPPSGSEMVAGLNGRFDPAGGNGAGQISGNIRDGFRPTFAAIRDAEESAAMTSATRDTPGTEAPATPVARPRRPSTAATSAASLPPKSAPAHGPKWSTAINGVYTGTYGSNPDDIVPAKLYVKFINNGSVNGILDGVFTVDVPPAAGAKPITYTYKLTGSPQPGNGYGFGCKPVGKPAPDAYALTQLWVNFERSLVRGSNGKIESSFNLDQISGKVAGNNGLFNDNKFEATRDKDGTANLDRVMAAAEAGAASVVSTTAPAPLPSSPSLVAAPAQSPRAPSSSTALDEINNTMATVRDGWGSAPVAAAVRPSIEGVFSGTYTREGEPPTKFKLTITHNGDGPIGLAGVATIYLPTDSGTKAYTYNLRGVQVPYSPNNFSLNASEWETVAPKDFKNFAAMGFNGEFRSNVNQHTARIVSVPESTPNVAASSGTKNPGSKRPPSNHVTYFLPTFEAAWSATESADIKGTIAAQKAIGNADLVAALKARDDVIKNAKPKQLASKYLVRKSPAYWNAHRSDFIREIFDGGFASDVGDDGAFQSLFTSYVELFSEHCAAYLPASHQTVTITTIITRGAIVSKSSTTLEMDPRFIAKYAEYVGVDPAPGSDQEKEQTAKTMAIAGKIFHAGGPSHGVGYSDANAALRLMAAHGAFGGAGMEKFFATELKPTGPSAALRQMGENLLRGATGEPSLQEAGARIDGAQAETDQDLPPGRFTRLVDAAHAFYREPGNARLESRFETAFDETLAAKCHGVMTPEEEYYYANDFEGRFRNQIMQPQAFCSDPAWSRLHPIVEQCVAALQ